jgi:hypothetical protein
MKAPTRRRSLVYPVTTSSALVELVRHEAQAIGLEE